MVLPVPKEDQEAFLIRLFDNGRETLGQFLLFKNWEIIFQCKMLELPWKDNLNNVSCIPKGRYKIEPIESPERGKYFSIPYVQNRELIRIHIANYVRELQGCQAPGSRFYDIDKDGLLDVTDSKRTLEILVGLIPRPIKYTIV